MLETWEKAKIEYSHSLDPWWKGEMCPIEFSFADGERSDKKEGLRIWRGYGLLNDKIWKGLFCFEKEARKLVGERDVTRMRIDKR